MLDSLFNETLTSTTFSFSSAIMTIMIAIVLGGLISVTYMKTNPNGFSQNFTLTMIILPVIVAMIILLIGNNIARAFSLAGAFSIIRFRSAPGDPRDIAYVLFTMAAGLACGVGMLGYAVLFTVILCLLMILLSRFNFAANKRTYKLLKVTIPENLVYEEAFTEVFARFGVGYELKKIRTAELGSLYELVYNVTLNDSINQKAFLDAIRCRNGNLDLSLTLVPGVNTDN
ncbi:hypothetical protein PAALTS15_22403 [Paenibacillus alvei TS-15]|uniref:DUF4956 domain-containing protein n=1 Tax=Paenibacillus alvei TS-15 TaxID=1117108 RepID=S9TRS1_PAEAL|nr:DUF4956 domain-containing protein [Paenibacillus alvei]EPY04996.1 hypothetical protein PAALTS15_22403 [Paenibacillus alvei TS-15]